MSTQQTAAAAAAANGQREHNTTPPQPLNRSCESCRSLKVRCLPDANVPNQCQRCTKAKRACIFVAPQRRRPRKRTDSRVAQLEREMAALRTVLKNRHVVIEEKIKEQPETGGEDEAEADEATGKPNHHDKQSTNPAVPFTRPYFQDASQSPSHRSSSQISGDGSSSLDIPALTLSSSFHDKNNEGDVIDRGVISMDTAEELVSLFLNDLALCIPFMVFPANTTARHLRLKPVLFLAILAASSIAVDVSLANVLNREILALYAQRFFFGGEKSLEMVQALLLMNIYYLPPESPSAIQAYQYSHIAATMALEIGIASKKRVPRRPNHIDRQPRPAEKFDEQMAEQARTILVCYHLASNVAMRTRRPNMLPYNDWIKECARLLSRSPIESDRKLASWFELQVITDEALSSFGLDDTSSTAILTETRVNSVLRLFDKKIEDWKEDIDPEHLTVPMILEYQYTALAVYELGIGEGYRDPHAIKREYYTLPAPDSDSFSKRPVEPLSAMRVDLTIKWLHAAQGLLNTFLGCDVHTMRKMPNMTYMRTVLGLMVLLKIYFSVKSGALGEVIKPDTINVEGYMDSLVQRFTEASAACKYPIPSRWLRVVGGKARVWFQRFQEHHKAKQESQRQDDYINAPVAPSTSTMSSAWNGGLVPLPTPTVPPGPNVSFSREFMLQQQQQQQQPEKPSFQHQPHQFSTNLAYPNLSATQVSADTAKSSTVTTTTTNTFSNYSQATTWIQPPPPPPPPPPSSSSPTNPNIQHHQQQHIDPHTGAYHLSAQDLWTLQQQQQQYINLSNPQSFPSIMPNTDQGMFPIDMEFEWVAEHGMFQLPTF